MAHSDERDGRKPYKRYRSGRPRRTVADADLAAAHIAPRSSAGPRGERRPPAPHRQEPAVPRGAPGGYRRYSAGPGGLPPGAASGGRRRRGFRWWHPLAVLLLLVAIAAVVGTVIAWPSYKKFDHAVGNANSRLGRKESARVLTPDKGAIWRRGTTLLLLGVDSKNIKEPARSDTIMLLHFNPDTHSVNQLSIPRDTRVQLSNGAYDKINVAMALGGATESVRTITQYLGIPINHVMVVNFKGFSKLVDAVGGLDFRVPETISSDFGLEGSRYTVTFEKGMRHFDGQEALQYVRIRYADDDFHRAARQQAFVQALTQKLTSPSTLPQLPDVGVKFMRGVATDLTTSELLQLGYLKWRANGGSKVVLAGEPQYMGGVAYVMPPDETAKQAALRRFLTH